MVKTLMVKERLKSGIGVSSPLVLASKAVIVVNEKTFSKMKNQR